MPAHGHPPIDEDPAPAGPLPPLLETLQRLLAIEAPGPADALTQAAAVVAQGLDVEKVDVFLHNPARRALVAVGVSDTPLGQREREIGLDVLPLAPSGRLAGVFLTGRPYRTGHAERDPALPDGFTSELGVRSVLAVPLAVEGARRGVLAVDAVRPAAFTAADLHFLEAVAHWVGALLHRVETEEAARAALVARQVAEERQRLAEEAVRLRDDYLAAATHDLRTPLTALRGRAQLLRRRLDSAAGVDVAGLRAQVEALDAATMRMIATVDELADVTLLEAGQALPLRRERVDLGALARAAASEIAVARPGAALTLDVPTTPVEVKGDGVRLQRVVENVLGNAFKYSPAEAPIDVTVRACAGCATITISDRGVGIPDAELSRVFDRFYRATTAGGRPGTGLGLWGVKAIMAQHGGNITLTSVVGQGSSVVLSLPHVPAVRPYAVGTTDTESGADDAARPTSDPQ